MASSGMSKAELGFRALGVRAREFRYTCSRV